MFTKDLSELLNKNFEALEDLLYKNSAVPETLQYVSLPAAWESARRLEKGCCAGGPTEIATAIRRGLASSSSTSPSRRRCPAHRAKTGRGEDKDDKGSRESPSEIVGSKECACLILTPPESDCFSSLPQPVPLSVPQLRLAAQRGKQASWRETQPRPHSRLTYSFRGQARHLSERSICSSDRSI